MNYIIQIAGDLALQARNLQTSIQTAKQESEQNRRLLIDKLLSSSLSPLNNSQTYDEASDRNAQQYDHNYPVNSRMVQSTKTSHHMNRKNALTSQQLKFAQMNSNGDEIRRSTPSQRSTSQNAEVEEEEEEENDEEDDDEDDEDDEEEEDDDEDNEKNSEENKNSNQYEPVDDEEEELDDDEEEADE